VSVHLGGQPCIDPAALARQCEARGWPTSPWYGLANGFSNPIGQAPGRGTVLMLYGDLARLDLEDDHDLTFRDSYGNTLTVKNLVVTLAEAATPGARGDANAAYRVELADPRLIAAMGPPLGQDYNVRGACDGEYVTATLNDGAAWTWATLLEHVWDANGFFTPWPGLPAAADGVPEDLFFDGVPSYDALGDLLDRLGFALKYDPYFGLFSIIEVAGVDLSTSAWLIRHDGGRLLDADPVEPRRVKVPENVRVVFPALPDGDAGAPPGPWHTEDAETGYEGALAGTLATLPDDLPALYDSAGAVTNQAELTARAEDRAAGLARRAGVERLGRLYTGAAHGLTPGGVTAAVAHRDAGADGGPFAALTTAARQRHAGPSPYLPWPAAFGGAGDGPTPLRLLASRLWPLLAAMARGPARCCPEVTLVTNVCPPGSGETGTTVEYTTFDTCTWAAVDSWCVIDPTGCCEEGSGSGDVSCACDPGVTFCFTLAGVDASVNGDYVLEWQRDCLWGDGNWLPGDDSGEGTLSCCERAASDYLCVTITHSSGDMACLDGQQVVIRYDRHGATPTPYWANDTPHDIGTCDGEAGSVLGVGLSPACVLTLTATNGIAESATGSVTLTAADCDPLSLTGTIELTGGMGTGTVTVEVTEYGCAAAAGLNLGGGAPRLTISTPGGTSTATYRPVGAFDCDGTTTFSLLSVTGDALAWPATLEVAPCEGGGGGGGGITVEAAGASTLSAPASSLTFNNVPVEEGDDVIVAVGCTGDLTGGSYPTATWNGMPMTRDARVLTGGTTEGTLALFRAVNSVVGGASLIVSFGVTVDDAAVAVARVSGATGTLDGTPDTDSGASGDPGAGGLTTTAAASAVLAAHLQTYAAEPADEGTPSAGYTDQAAGTMEDTGGNWLWVTLTGKVTSAAGAQSCGRTGGDANDGWAGAIVAVQ
jgi:hypothetical protein